MSTGMSTDSIFVSKMLSIVLSQKSSASFDILNF